LKTPIIGRLTAAVDSSCIDMLAGLSKCDMRRTPPGCWPDAGALGANTKSKPAKNAPTIATGSGRRFIFNIR